MVGDDLLSIVSSAFEDDENNSLDPPEEHEVKFDPDAVKTELEDFDHDESQIDDAFLRSINCEDDERAITVEATSERDYHEDKSIEEIDSNRRRSTRCRTRIIIDPLELDPSDDIDDEDWNGKSPNKKKRTSTARPGRRKINSQNQRKRKEGKTKRQYKIKSEDDSFLKFESEGQDTENVQIRKEIKDEPQCKGTKRVSEWKKVSEMDPEELENYRERRRKDAARRNRLKKNAEKSDGNTQDDEDEQTPKTKKIRKKSTGSPKGSSCGRRKKVAEMTEEEREIMKAKWREEARLKRERQRQRMTPEEREEYLKRHREQRRMQRAVQKVTMTEQEREEYNKKARERKKEKRSLLTAEERKERAQRVTMRRIERLSKMTEDEKAQYRMNNYMSYMARLSRMSSEEIEEKRKKRREYSRKRLEKLTEDDREKRRERIRQYRWNMDPVRKERFLKQLRDGYKRRVERLKSQGKWDEVKEKWRQGNKERKQSPATSKKTTDGTGRKRGKPVRFVDETPEQRSERLREQKRLHQKRATVKKKLAIQQMLEKGMSLEEVSRQMETPEQRERRLMKSRINKAKLDLRKRLVSSGAPPEEIQTRLEELAATYKPSRNFRPYKPRPDTWKPIEPNELELLAKPATQKPKQEPEAEASTTAHSIKLKPVETQSQPDIKIIFDGQPTEYYAVSPTAASSSSYVSGSVTPEPLALVHQSYSSSQQIHHQTQYHHHHLQQPQASSSCMYPSQQGAHAQLFVTPQPPQPGQAQTFTLQHVHVVEPVPIAYQETTHSSMVNIYQPSEYASSYDASSPPHSPPPSPGTSSNYDWAAGTTPNSSISTTPSFNQPEEFKRKRGRPKKGDPPVIKPPKKCGRRVLGQPFGALHKDVIRDAICDECGNAYNSFYLQEHKRNFHNPHYKNGECTICGQKFKQSRNFYKHYKEDHLGADKNVPLPSDQKTYMCEGCGRAFHQEGNMRKHWYYMHGPGRLTENFHKCHLCPGEKFFKQKLTLLQHFKKCHPGYNPGVYKCSRCTDNFPNETQLNEHVKDKHPESYHPCKYCRSVKFSELGLKFHYSNGCLKIPKEEWVQLRKEIGDNSIERLQTRCEFCDRVVGLMNLKRHYWEMHNVEEETFNCMHCDKTFKRREYLGAHIVDHHNLQPEEWLDEVRKLNVKDRSKIEIKNLEGNHGGAPLNPLRKPEVEKKIQKKGPTAKKGRRKPRKKGTDDDDDDKLTSEPSDSEVDETPKKKAPRGIKNTSTSTPGRKRGRKKKKVVVTSEDEESKSEVDLESSTTWIGDREGASHSGGELTENESQSALQFKGKGKHDEFKEKPKPGDDGTVVQETDCPTAGPSNVSFNPVVCLSSVDLENVVKTEVLSDEEDVQIAYIFKDIP